MKTTRHAVAAAALALATVAFAADTPKQKPAAEVPKLTEIVDVRVINVDVVVTDKRGNRIRGLTKDDFEIYENGKAKAISNFYEVEAPAKTAAAAPSAPTTLAAIEQIPDNQKRRIIFYVDNLSLMPFNRNRVFKEMKEFARRVMRPGDEAMIATFNRSMKIRAAFTRDPIQIQQTLDTLAGESALGVSAKSERRDATNAINDAMDYDQALSTARNFAQSAEHDLRQSVTSLNGLMTTLAGVEGKKIVVLTTEGFEMQPGRDLFMLVDEVARQKGWTAGGGTMLEAMTFNGSLLIEDVARTANANGITIYAIHAGGLGAQNQDIMADSSRSTSFTVAQAALSNSTESLELIAERTGGVASVNTNNFAGAFQNIEKDLDAYYSLGYRAGTERVDRQRELEVRVKNRNYIVRNRQSFVEKSTFAEMNDRVIANLLYRTKANDLKVAVRSGSPVAQEDGLFRVPIEIQIPMDSLTFLPQGEVTAGGFTVYVAVANKDGDMSDVSRKQHQMTLNKEQVEQAKGKYYTYALTLLMEPGLNKISVGVVDDVSNVTGFAKDQVIAQDMR